MANDKKTDDATEAPSGRRVRVLVAVDGHVVIDTVYDSYFLVGISASDDESDDGINIDTNTFAESEEEDEDLLDAIVEAAPEVFGVGLEVLELDDDDDLVAGTSKIIGKA